MLPPYGTQIVKGFNLVKGAIYFHNVSENRNKQRRKSVASGKKLRPSCERKAEKKLKRKWKLFFFSFLPSFDRQRRYCIMRKSFMKKEVSMWVEEVEFLSVHAAHLLLHHHLPYFRLLIEIHFTLLWIKYKKSPQWACLWLIYRNIYERNIQSSSDINNARLYLNVLFLSFIFIYSSTLEGISLFLLHAAKRMNAAEFSVLLILIQPIQQPLHEDRVFSILNILNTTWWCWWWYLNTRRAESIDFWLKVKKDIFCSRHIFHSYFFFFFSCSISQNHRWTLRRWWWWVKEISDA